MMTTDESRMNVAALKRVDPYVKEILDTATHVALYTFNEDNKEWDKIEVEGALFVYSRNGEPYNSIVIMNRLSTENQVEPVMKDLDLQLQEPFLLYRNSKGRIHCIWFYDKDECVRITSMLNKLIKESENSNKTMTKGKKNAQCNSNNVDIFSMLSKAQEDYNTNRHSGAPNTNNMPSSGNDSGKSSNTRTKSPTKNESNLLGTLAAPLGSEVTSQSVMDFFAKAKVNSEQFKSIDKPSGKVAPVNNDLSMVMRLMSNPAANLQHIEKYQRTTTHQPSQSSQPAQMISPSVVNTNNVQIQKQLPKFTKKKNKGIVNQGENNSINPINTEERHSFNNNSKNDTRIINSTHNDTVSSPSFLRIQSPVQNQNSRTNCNTSNNIPLPFMFTNSTDNTQIPEKNVSTPISAKQTSSTSAPALKPPLMFATRSPATESVNRPIEPLTRNQLLQAFNYLLRKDPDFVNKLHEAYVKSFSEILS